MKNKISSVLLIALCFYACSESQISTSREPAGDVSLTDRPLINEEYENRLTSVRSAHSLSIISWNLKHFGRVNKAPYLRHIAAILRPADIVTIQEVGDDDGPPMLRELAKILSASLSEPICFGYTAHWKRDPDHERYGYLWKLKRVLWKKSISDGPETNCRDGGEQIPSVSANLDQVSRPAANPVFYFVSNARVFRLSTVHLVPTKKHPRNEVGPTFQNFSDELPSVVSGDFNLPFSEKNFAPAMVFHFRNAFARAELTSLRMRSRELASAYDNFFYRGFRLLNQQVLNLYVLLGGDAELEQEVIYDSVSDHSPVYAEFEFAAKEP